MYKKTQVSDVLVLTRSFNFVYRVQQVSFDDADRNRFLVTFVDYSFDDFGGNQPPVYPGLSTVWGSLARSKVLSAHISMKLQAYLCSDVHHFLRLITHPRVNRAYLHVTYSCSYLL